MIDWRWHTVATLTTRQMHTLCSARIAVFIVEQRCSYQDLDELDLEAEHLVAWAGSEVAAYLRLLAPGTRFAEPSLGRILTTQPHRGSGLGRELVARGLAHCALRYPGLPVRIGAQAHLERFYASFGFIATSEPYLEDDIVHIEMLRSPSGVLHTEPRAAD